MKSFLKRAEQNLPDSRHRKNMVHFEDYNLPKESIDCVISNDRGGSDREGVKTWD